MRNKEQLQRAAAHARLRRELRGEEVRAWEQRYRQANRARINANKRSWRKKHPTTESRQTIDYVKRLRAKANLFEAAIEKLQQLGIEL